jgi:hypothetical protein
MFGTPYQMGYAQGQLLKDEIQMMSVAFWDDLEQIIQNATGYPMWVDKLIYQVGLKPALDITYLLTELYTPDYFYEEIRGLADGSGVDYWTLVHFQMFPELIKAQCSMVGAWGPATQQSSSGSLVQLRALDFMTNGPIQSVPVIAVYHPNAGNGHAFATVSWAGFIGAITGISSAPVGVCEKVFDGYDGENSRHGIPFHFLMRDVLQWDQNVNDAINRAQKASRTCAIFLGVGDPTNGFRAMEYTYPNLTVYSDQNYPVYQNHPRMTGLVYIDKHVQPSTDPCIANVLKAQYGQITATVMIRDLAPMLQPEMLTLRFTTTVVMACISSTRLSGSTTILSLVLTANGHV